MAEKVFYNAKDGLRICAIVQPASHQPARGNIVLAHGITVDKNEDLSDDTGLGAFQELTNQLKDFNVIRFDFRGHGESGGKQENMTIAGEYLDLAATISYIYKKYPIKTSVVASSFGAVVAVKYAAEYSQKSMGRWIYKLLFPRNVSPSLFALVLWNPVLDLQKTFINPIVPWAKSSFNDKGYKSLAENGYLLLDSSFRIGKHLVQEMRVLKPYKFLRKVKCPVLTLHGDKDTYVPFNVSKQHAKPNWKSEFINVKGAEHGFLLRKERNLVIQKTVDWLTKNAR